MIKSKILITISLVMLLFTSLNANNISVEQARVVGQNYFHERYNISGDIKHSDIQLELKEAVTAQINGVTENLYYIFDVNQKGFILVCATDLVYPVLAYSFEDTFSDREMPPALNDMMEWYQAQISYAIENNITQDVTIAGFWAKYSNIVTSVEKLASVSPMLTSIWDQGCYYNDDCPDDNSSGQSLCYHVPTGCGATAQAQIMRYHGCPSYGNGTSSYYASGYGTLSVDHGATNYEWTRMNDKAYPVQDYTEIPELMYHIGVSVRMSYSSSGSGSMLNEHKASLQDHFWYKTTMQVLTRSNYTDAQWHIFLKADLDNNLPILYSGYGDSQYSGGHAFVMDGYQSSTSYHFNWGWGGSYDGYFTIDNLVPGGGGTGGGSYNYNFHQLALMKIEPSNTCISSVSEQTELEENINIYPNPSDGNFTIDLGDFNNTQININIYNHLGQEVLSLQEDNTNKFDIELSNMPSGIYHVEIQTESAKVAKRILIN